MCTTGVLHVALLTDDEDDGDGALQRLREQRVAQMQAEASSRASSQQQGYGRLTDVPHERIMVRARVRATPLSAQSSAPCITGPCTSGRTRRPRAPACFIHHWEQPPGVFVNKAERRGGGSNAWASGTWAQANIHPSINAPNMSSACGLLDSLCALHCRRYFAHKRASVFATSQSPATRCAVDACSAWLQEAAALSVRAALHSSGLLACHSAARAPNVNTGMCMRGPDLRPPWLAPAPLMPLQACDALDEFLATLAHRHSATRFVRVAVPRRCDALAQLRVEQPPGAYACIMRPGTSSSQCTADACPGSRHSLALGMCQLNGAPHL